jgi:hypothetical protein
LAGYNLLSMKNEVIKKELCYVASQDNFHAHGKTIKQAIKDLKFKLIAEKFKKEPITKDTKITVEYYRIITGACSFGCRSWMDANNIPYKMIGEDVKELKPIKASELLSLLEKSHAWGLETFKSLCKF